MGVVVLLPLLFLTVSLTAPVMVFVIVLTADCVAVLFTTLPVCLITLCSALVKVLNAPEVKSELMADFMPPTIAFDASPPKVLNTKSEVAAATLLSLRPTGYLHLM